MEPACGIAVNAAAAFGPCAARRTYPVPVMETALSAASASSKHVLRQAARTADVVER